MAKANFHKNQRVYVKPVGTWAIVEKVLPQWVKGLDEPLKVHYDVGLGREFSTSELSAERGNDNADEAASITNWRILREPNRWQDENNASDHPFPGTFPRVCTDEKDWGGWRVPSSEYDRDPHRIEFQARIIAASPQLLKMAKVLTRMVAQNPDEFPQDIVQVAKQSRAMLREIYETQQNDIQAAAE